MRQGPRVDARLGQTGIARGIGLHALSSRPTTVQDVASVGVSQRRAMASGSGGDATSEMLESRQSIPLDSH